MGIQPIDLQTLFTQLEKVSKMQVQATQSAQLQSVLNQEESSRKISAKKAIVEEASDVSDPLSTVKERNGSSSQQQQQKKENETSEEEKEEKKASYFSDPELGQHIDVLG